MCDQSLLNTVPKKNPNQFIEALYSLIESQKYTHLIDWSENNNSFTIFKPYVFSQVLLPSLCKHSNLDSFIRQLNMYCFKKCRNKSQADSISYWHTYFVRGEPELLKNIIRKNPRRILKQKEAQLRGLGIDARSSNSTLSKEQECKAKEPNRNFAEISMNKESTQPSSLNNDSSSVFSYFSQILGKMDPKCDKATMTMIRNYLNDEDDDNGYENFETAYGIHSSKKIKYSQEYPVQANPQYVQMDCNTLNFTPIQSTESKGFLNAQLPRTVQVFDGRDYIKCQNLIKNLFEVQNRKNVDSYSFGSDSTHSCMQELASWKTGDFTEESFI